MFGLGGLGPRGSFILPAKGASVNRAAVLSCESWFKRPHQSTTRYSWKKEARALESAPSFGCKLKTSGSSSFDVCLTNSQRREYGS
nr:MAG TPA: hypothetical protein [Caudoviricetes sp.]